MYTKYKDFYKKYGIRLNVDFLNPKIINADTIELPYYSLVHYLSCFDEEDYPSKNIPLFKDIKDIFVTNILEYKYYNYRLIGEPKKQHINENTLIKGLNKKYPSIKTIHSKQFEKWMKRKITKIERTVPVINYSILPEIYKYHHTYMEKFSIYKNMVITAMHEILEMKPLLKNPKLKEEPIVYLYSKIPPTLYNYSLVEKYIRERPNREFADLFYNEGYFILMELFKYIDPETRHFSCFNIVGERDLKYFNKITLILTQGLKTVFLNLGVLFSFVKGIDLENHDKLDPDMVKRMLFVLMDKMIKHDPYDAHDIEKDNYIMGFDKLEDPKLLLQKLKEDTKEIDEKIDVEKTIKEITEKDDTKVVKDIKYKFKYEHMKLDDLLKEDKHDLDETMDILNEMLSNNKIDKKKYDKLTKLIQEALDKKSPFDPKKKNKDMVKINQKELEIDEKEKKLPKPKVLLNEKDAEDTIGAIDKKYMKQIYYKDITSTIMSIQRAGLIVKDIRVNRHKDILGTYDEYEIDVNDLGKSNYTIKIVVPLVSDDGSYMISGNTYVLRRQKMDLPIKKINYNRVSLASAVGKVFVDSAPYTKMDRGYSIKKELLRLEEEKKISHYVSGKLNIFDVKLPKVYSEIARYTKTFKYKDYIFNFSYLTRNELLKNPDDIKKIESDKFVICGKTTKDEPLLMDFENNVYILRNGRPVKIDNFFNIVPIDKTRLKQEYSLAMFLKSYIPVAWLLSYYMGFENMVKALGAHYIIMDGNKRVSTDENTIVFKTNDKTVLITVNNETQRMILAGMNHDPKILKQVPYHTLNHKDQFLTIFNLMGLKLAAITNIKVYEYLFVDPVTKTILKDKKEPTTFVGLLIRASELLTDDYYLHPSSLKGFTIKSYDRFSQFIYRTLIDAIIAKKNEEFFGKSKLVVDPFKVWRITNEDSSSVLQDDINPIHYLKQKEDTTYLGFNGRAKEGINKDARTYHPDDIGVISEGGKDSGDVGITAYLSANPKLKNIRGLPANDGGLVWSNVLSTTNMLMPFTTTDDPKRVNYANIQNSHIIPISNPKVFPIRTGYDSVIAYRLPSKFVAWAEEDGKVIKVGNKTVTIEYKTKGKKTYKFPDWTSKEESHTSYRHIMSTNLKEGQKVKEHDIIYYDESFFEPDMFEPNRVTYRAGTNVRVGFVEAQETFEDATLISEKLSKNLHINYVKVRDLILDKTDEIQELVKIGTELKPNDPLFVIKTNLVGDDKIDKKTMDLLEGFVKNTPKAKYKGKLIKIKVYYNCEKSELSKSLQELVNISEKYMIDPITKEQLEGKVNSSYSVASKPLEPGKVHIKFYIELDNYMGTGDKGVVANQLKTTVTNTFDYDIKTEDGDDIDILFSYIGVSARIVNSTDLMGGLAIILEKVTKNALDIYYGGNKPATEDIISNKKDKLR